MHSMVERSTSNTETSERNHRNRRMPQSGRRRRCPSGGKSDRTAGARSGLAA
uniref:Uncharacterized protein n=1 Tax=Arundo donax TaxID=35708 RepID=A0A0A9HGV1_ARUDO